VLDSQAQKNEEIQIGLSWSEGLGKYKLAKVITLAPRFLVKNNLGEPILFREHGGAPRGRSTLEPGERQPLQFMRKAPERLLTVAFPGLNAEWSAPINMEDIGSVHFRLAHPDQPDAVRLLRADVQIDGSTIFVYIHAAEEGWPFVIENQSQWAITLSQTVGSTSVVIRYELRHRMQDQRQTSPDAGSIPTKTYSLAPKSTLDYAWDQPSARDKKILLTINGSRRSIDIMEIGDLVPFKFAVRKLFRPSWISLSSPH
jgi:vacuolar protein sorting-associated protein 13A/C